MLGSGLPAPAQTLERAYGRSLTLSTGGVAASSQMLASQAGAQVLARGGSAIDAAIAMNTVLSLTEPMMNGPGGDLFALYWDAKLKKLHGLNSSGWAPQALTIEHLRRKGARAMPADGIDSVTVPGCVAGWDRLHKRFGKLPWADLFTPVTRLARDGFPVAEMAAGSWTSRKLERPEASPKVFLPTGRPPVMGAVIRNPELAHFYEVLARDGANAFYKGEAAKAILRTSAKLGGTMSAADLAEFEPEWVEPISTGYRGWTVYELPPNGQGVSVLEMLNMLETHDVPKLQPLGAERFHLSIEAVRLAYADMYRYVADPRFAQVPTAALLSKDYARRRAQQIDLTRARCDPAAGDPFKQSDTTYLSVVDAEGNIASWIQSLSGGFGAFVAVEGMGFMLHNRGSGFAFDPRHPNGLAGRKRPFHTIIPAFMERGGRHIGFGIMGGPNQPAAHLQFVSNIADYGMNLQAALEHPRFTKRTRTGCDIVVDGRVPAATVDALNRLGHKINVRAPYSGVVGIGQAVMYDEGSKVKSGASSPAGDGAAIPEPWGLRD